MFGITYQAFLWYNFCVEMKGFQLFTQDFQQVSLGKYRSFLVYLL